MPERPKRIQLKGHGHQEESRALAAITPGHMIELATDSAGTEGVQVHSTAGGKAQPAFALEDALQGKTIDDAYAEGNLVTYVIGKSGDRFFAWLNSGEVTAFGSKLTSNGDGTLKVATGSDEIVAQALEAVDATDSGAASNRIRVEII